jgi:hypothetical protein
MSKLYELFSNSAIESFGKALRIAVRINEDYASLVELDYAEKEDELAIILKKFLRRLDASARRYEREHPGKYSFKPTEKDLDEIMRLAYQYGVRLVCASIMAHALVRSEKGDEKNE